MGLFTIIDRSENPAPPQVYNFRLFLLALAATMGSAQYGYDSGFIGGTLSLPAFQHKFGLDVATGNQLSQLKSNIVSTFQAGAFFGAAISYFFNEKLGRKKTLLIFGTIFNIGVVLQVASHGIVGLIYAGRALTGLSTGTVSMIVPIYIAEWSPPACRGILVGSYEVVYQSFLVIAFWVNYGCKIHLSDDSESQWMLPFALQFIPGGLLLIAMSFQPESWRWLVRNGKVKEAQSHLANIRKLPTDHPYLIWELTSCESQIAEESLHYNGGKSNLWSKLKECTKQGVYNRILLALSVMIFQNLSGINALNYYSPAIFESIGFKGNNVDLLATGIFGIVKAVTNLGAIVIGIEKLGRRQSIITGSLGTIAAMLYLTIYTAVSGSFDHDVPKDAGAYFAIISVYFFAFCFAFSWNAVPFIYCSEIISNQIRDLGMAMAVMMQWLMQFVIVYSNPYMMANIKWGTFLFFTVCLIVSVGFTYYFIPETRGLSLENMDILFTAKGFAKQKRKETDIIIANLKDSETGQRNDFEDVKDDQEVMSTQLSNRA